LVVVLVGWWKVMPMLYCSSTVGCWPCCIEMLSRREMSMAQKAWILLVEFLEIPWSAELHQNCTDLDCISGNSAKLTAVDCAVPSNPTLFDSLIHPIRQSITNSKSR
jgi:hypothetical protein